MTTTADIRSERATARSLPLFERFPALARLPRAELGTFPSPVSHIAGVPSGGELWIKRDDLNAPAFGGNKVRALEFLLGGVHPGDTLLTIGGEGSTHVLATAAMGGRLGARTSAIRWRHDMNPESLRCCARAADLCAHIRTTPGPISALLLSLISRRARGVRWIPPGGTSPLGMLGHVNAALELAQQVARGELPRPDRVVVPFGTGGTAAGLALGFAIAGLATIVTAARVVPRVVANRRRLLALTRSCARLITHLDGTPVPVVSPNRVAIVNDVYGGGYGRPLRAARIAADILHRASGIVLDDSYSAKAFAVALPLPLPLAAPVAQAERVLFWLTFDGRLHHQDSGGTIQKVPPHES